MILIGGAAIIIQTHRIRNHAPNWKQPKLQIPDFVSESKQREDLH